MREAWVSPLVLGLKLLLGAELLWVTYRGILKNRTEGLAGFAGSGADRS